MKASLLFFLLFPLAISCSDVETKDKVVVYNLNDFIKKVEIRDTLCENETRRAKEDIKRENLSYNIFFFYDVDGTSRRKYFEHEEFNHQISRYLAKYKIKLDTTIMLYSDVRFPYDDLFTSHCYQQTMQKEIRIRYPNLADTILHNINRSYIMQHPDVVYEATDIDRTHDKYSGREFQDFKDRFKLNLAAGFKYPTLYKYKNERDFSYTTSFILMKNGHAKDLHVVATMQNKFNKKYKTYFENEVANAIKNTKWIVGTIYGIPVNTRISVTFLHK